MRSALIAAAICLSLAFTGPAAGEIQMPEAAKTNADARTTAEFEKFYEEIEAALKAKDLDKLISFYADDYQHHGITKKQLRFMWLEVLSEFSDLYSVHVFTRITVQGDDAILVCTGGLFGIEEGNTDYTTVDQWVKLNHWLTKVDGKWKMIGGATRSSPRGRGSASESHPFF